jgi:peroxiredoxin
MSRYRSIVPVAAAVAIATAAYLSWGAATSPAPAPPVSYTLLDGRRADLAALRGNVVLVNFWATTCSACVAEMPMIVATHEKFRWRGFDTLAVAMQYDPPTFVVDHARAHKLPFAVAIDNTGEIAKAFGDVRATPTSFLIDRRGQIVKRIVGAPDPGSLQTLIEKHLVAER